MATHGLLWEAKERRLSVSLIRHPTQEQCQPARPTAGAGLPSTFPVKKRKHFGELPGRQDPGKTS